MDPQLTHILQVVSEAIAIEQLSKIDVDPIVVDDHSIRQRVHESQEWPRQRHDSCDFEPKDEHSWGRKLGLTLDSDMQSYRGNEVGRPKSGADLETIARLGTDVQIANRPRRRKGLRKNVVEKSLGDWNRDDGIGAAQIREP